VQQSETNKKPDSSEKYKLECSARYLLRMSLIKRRGILERMEKRHGKIAIDKLKEHLKTQSALIQKAKEKAKEELKKLLGK